MTMGLATKTLHGGEILGASVVFDVEIVQDAAGAFVFDLIGARGGGDCLVVAMGIALDTQQNDVGFVTSAIFVAAFLAADTFAFDGFVVVGGVVVTDVVATFGKPENVNNFGVSVFFIPAIGRTGGF